MNGIVKLILTLWVFFNCSLDQQQLLQITAQPGENVTLPCKAPDGVTIPTFEWTRTDLEKYIYFQRDGHIETTEQDPSYVNRVLQEDVDLSLILKNASSNDKGTYKCRYIGEKGAKKFELINTVDLNVEGDFLDDTFR